MKLPMATATRANFHDNPIAMSDDPILQFETAKASDIQYVTTSRRYQQQGL